MLWLKLLGRFLSLLGLGLAVFSCPVWAASSQLVNPGTAVKFADSGQGDVVMTTQNIVTANGRISARKDKGSGAQPAWYEARCTFRGNATLTVGNTIDIYVATSDGTNEDGEIGTADAALTSTNSLLNLKPVGTLIVDKTTSNTDITASWQNVYIPTRYYSMAYWNGSGVTLQNTAGASFCVTTPMTPEQ